MIGLNHAATPGAMWLQEEEKWCVWGSTNLTTLLGLMDWLHSTASKLALGVACAADGAGSGFGRQPRLRRSLVTRAKALAQMEPADIIYATYKRHCFRLSPGRGNWSGSLWEDVN
jgi:hypothetical protein